MILNKDIIGKTYNQFIQYAINTSDAFLTVVLKNPSPPFCSKRQLTVAKEFLPSFEPDMTTIERWANREKKEIEQDTIYKTSCAEFIKELDSYLIHQRHNPIWPSTEILSGSSLYDINVYSTNQSVKELLLRPNSFLSWRFPYFPEDLSFFRNGYCWVYASSHEEYIEIFPKNEEEYNILTDMGIEFTDEYKVTPVSELFYEEY